jgi:hypothetical protein
MAADGKAYRDDLIAQTVEARVRAQGNAFDAEAYKVMLVRQPLDYIRSEIAAWERMAREVFEPGRPVGNVLDREQVAGKSQQAPGRPAGAYKA